MLTTFEEILGEIDVESADLTVWIEQNWILPVVENGRYLFDAADVERVRLIAELSRDMAVNQEAMPLVLRLLDQIFGLRRALADLNEAIKALPESARDQLEAELRRRSDGSGPGSEPGPETEE